MNPKRTVDPKLLPFFASVALLCVLASPWLVELVRFAWGSDLYSHIILIPGVSVALVWLRRDRLPPPSKPSIPGLAICAAGALGALVVAFLRQPPAAVEPHHQLTWVITALVLGIGGSGFLFLGGPFMRSSLLPFLFLVFMIPMPMWMEHGIEVGLQHASAEATHILFSLSGIPFLRDGQVFRLPSITMEIAQECSGIHSSLVLFITSIVAGQMFLRPGWRRWTLTLAVIPLAIVRNGFRVFTLGVLCERIGPHMIHHWIHHRGGPVFFALSLIPFFLLLVLLRGRAHPANPKPLAALATSTPGPEPRAEDIR